MGAVLEGLWPYLTLAALAVPAIAAATDADDWLWDEPPPAPGLAGPRLAPERTPPVDRSAAAWSAQAGFLAERLAASGLELGARVYLRIFKASRELELHLHDGERWRLVRTYPVCDVSGTLGPKRFEGDLQAPEGFYDVVAERLHPGSDFHLAFNLGFPNAFDAAWDRTGSNIMIHGGCASRGCFAMTDYYMEQLYVVVEAALRAGQDAVPVHVFPFRMTPDNLRARAGSRWIEFWRSLRPAYEHFEQFGEIPDVLADDGRYVVRSRAPDPVAGSDTGTLSAP